MAKRETAEKKRTRELQTCLNGTARMLESAARDVTDRMAAGDSTVKEVKEIADVLKVLVDLEQKLYGRDKEPEQETVRVVLSAEAEELSR